MSLDPEAVAHAVPEVLAVARFVDDPVGRLVQARKGDPGPAEKEPRITPLTSSNQH